VGDAKQHRFQDLAEQIKRRIQSGEIGIGGLLPSERELQSAYSVSRTTVRRAISVLADSGWVSTRLGRGVVAEIGRTSRRTGEVAFVDHRDTVHTSLFFSLHRKLRAEGLTLVHIDSQKSGTLAALEEAASQGFAAAFVWPKAFVLDGNPLPASSHGMPIISVDHSLMGEGTELVMSDHRDGARQAVSHLIGLGRRRIAVSGYFSQTEDAQKRFMGYVDAHYAQGMTPRACDYVFSSPEPDPYEDTRLLRFRLEQADRPDAVFVLHDMSVPSIVETILAVGLRIPEDVAVVGFGNDLPLSIEGFGLTTVAMQWSKVTDQLVERLLLRLNMPSAPQCQTLVPTRLVIRGSCGAPKETWMGDPYEPSSVTVTSRMAPSDPEASNRFTSSSSSRKGRHA
jgi:LacI family transcriptional regulator